ncbi:hypothetical protein EYC80_006899 [Monilinia laxa]|uniref:Uncharacterized protein n=1 Tax=Monilinia laxa TaxID=61186 RepID=A0A5N6JZH7_MONLA|nr:hypothetical protein EYC80_006899 [Monilinia laxa]
MRCLICLPDSSLRRSSPASANHPTPMFNMPPNQPICPMHSSLIFIWPSSIINIFVMIHLKFKSRNTFFIQCRPFPKQNRKAIYALYPV